ncbi:MAG: HAMP domain-containing protein [Phycisphaerae bacterium]|nr:HAMP domain-containing protein [Phycisphaerae bacterium]
MKIAHKISLSFLIAVVLLSGISGAVFYSKARTNLEQAIFAHLETTAKSRAHHIENLLEEREREVELMAESFQIETTLETIINNHSDSTKLIEETKSELEEHLCPEIGLYEIFILKPDGKIIASTDQNRIGLDKSTDAYFLAAKNKTYIKDAYYSQTTKRNSICISTPVRADLSGKLLGVLVARYNLQSLHEITTERTGLGETGEIYLVNKDRFMLTPSRFGKDTILKQKVDTINVRRCLAHKDKTHPMAGQEIAVFPDYRDVRVLGTHEYIPRMQWCLLAEINEKEALAPLAKIKRLGIIIMLLIPVVAWLIGTVLARFISKPIHELHRGTDIIGAGNLDHKVGTDAKDEIGQLSRAFDQMTGNLRKTTTSISNLEKEVAEREKAERALQAANRFLSEAAKKLEDSNRELQDFAYIASHDLREPLRKISSFGGLLKESLGANLNPDDQENLEFMVNGADRMNQMIEGLLVYSRLYTKEAPPEVVDLNETVEQVIQLELAALLQETAATIEVPQPLPKVWAVPLQMNQLLQNLIGNGIKYRREEIQPRIIVTAKRIAQDTLRIEVQDNGIGIKEEFHGDIFAMFRRLHSRQEYEGAGIGLAVCKKIVEKHGGQIGVESKQGQGATFWFTLSLAKQEEESAERLQNVVQG